MYEIITPKKLFVEFIATALLCLLVYRVKGQFDYPPTPTVDSVNNYFGVRIEDNYRWLEQTNAPEVRNWVERQNQFCRSYFTKIVSLDKIEANFKRNSGYFIEGLSDDEKYSLAVFSPGEFSNKSNYENYSPILYCKTKFENWKELVDPSRFRNDPTENVRLTSYKLSPNEAFLAFNISRNGSDWNEIMVINMKTGKTLTDHLLWIKSSSPQWYKEGFFYEKYHEPKKGREYLDPSVLSSLFYHKLGTDQAEDERINIDNLWDADVLDGKNLVVFSNKLSSGRLYNMVSVVALKDEAPYISQPKTFMLYPAKNRYKVNVIKLKNDSAVVLTNLHASKGMIEKYNVNEVNRFDTLVPEFDEVLETAFYFRNSLNCLYEKNLDIKLVKFNAHHKPEKIFAFAPHTSISLSIRSNSIRYSESTFDLPPMLNQFYYESFSSGLTSTVSVRYTATDHEVKFIEYPGSDGVKIPMMLFYKKGLKLTGNNPVLLETYGGFGVINSPRYHFGNILWTENQGILAVAYIRGGGEKGRNWHHAATRINKQKSIDDFVAGARFLIENNYTTADRLGITGSSNGGMIVAAAAIQHPELFKAVVADVGVYDMLRYDKFTIGKNLSDEYGSSSDSCEFKALLKYSPLHNIRTNVQYPAMLILTSDFDDRVPPLHSYKFTASLQHCTGNKNPVILNVGKNAGHQGNVNGAERYRQDAYKYAFLFNAMGIEPKIVR